MHSIRCGVNGEELKLCKNHVHCKIQFAYEHLQVWEEGVFKPLFGSAPFMDVPANMAYNFLVYTHTAYVCIWHHKPKGKARSTQFKLGINLQEQSSGFWGGKLLVDIA